MKSELEICVKSLDSKDEVLEKLKNLGFTIKEEFMMKDIYYVKDNIEISFSNSHNLLSDYILVRNVEDRVEFVIKRKKYDDTGDILYQENLKCGINNVDCGCRFIEALGYKELFRINDLNILLSNGKNEIYVQDVEELGVYLEMESKNIYSNNDNGKSIEEIIDNFNSYNLNVKSGEYFANKSFDMLEKIYR